jgi:hypothetical protein
MSAPCLPTVLRRGPAGSRKPGRPGNAINGSRAALAAWVGAWRQYDNKIVLVRVGDRLSTNGEAYWPGKSIAPANEGGFSGTEAPSGRRLHFSGGGPDPCLVDLTLAGEFLFVDDNRMCGGHNTVFSGIFIRRPKRTK